MKFYLIKMNQYFRKSYEPFRGGISVKVDLTNYATKTDFKNGTGTDTSKLSAKSDLASLKAEVDKLDIGKWIPVPIDLSKLSDVVKNDVVKNTVYDKFDEKLNNIDTNEFVLKTMYDTAKSDLEKKLPDTSGLVQKLDYNDKTAEIEKAECSINCDKIRFWKYVT